MANNCTPNIQKAIFDLYTSGSWKPNVGVIDFCMSPSNGATVQTQMITQNGKTSTYAITYPKSVCTEPTDTFNCNADGEDVEFTECKTFTSFDLLTSNWINAPISSFRDLGSLSAMQTITHQVTQQIEKIKMSLNIETIVALRAAVGCINSTTPTKTLKLINNQGAPVFGVDVDIMADFQDAGFAQKPILLGNRTAAKFINGINKGGINNNGSNIAAMNTFDFFYDSNINSTYAAPTTPGNDVMFAILPSIVNLTTYSQNAGIFASRSNEIDWTSIDPTKLINSGDTYIYTVLQDPSTGILFDFSLIFEPKCQKFQWRVSLLYKLVTLDLIGCKDNCFNGIVMYDVCAELPVECIA